jgi:hypothetical protein
VGATHGTRDCCLTEEWRMPASYNDAKHRRHRAAEMRALSANMKDMEAAEMMLPDDYDKFADRADIRSNGGVPSGGI